MMNLIKRLTEMVNEEKNFLLKNSNNYTIVKREEKYNEIKRKKKRIEMN